MKKLRFPFALAITTLLFLMACSTKKNTWIAKNSHALSTKYNILYNGGIALDKGITVLKSQYKDNFWETLPVERMIVAEDQTKPGKSKNADFDRAETKATKAIQKHSMNIDGGEKNSQMDEAHLMLGKSRYYDQRFIPALEAFNYVLYKYPNSDKINEVKIWREKTNMRLDNDALAVANLNRLLQNIKFKDQIFADANATIAQAFLNLKQKDSAIAKLKLATKFTKQNEEKARYHFILGQIYEDLNYADSAFAQYQKIIEMNRNASRLYVMQAHAKQAQQFDYAKGDTIVFLKKFRDLLKDRENRPFLDILNYQMGVFYDKNKKTEVATKYYNLSLKNKKDDDYLIASNYKNLANINFNKAKYVVAGKYYDSVLSKLNSRTREFRLFTKKRENLEDVIKFEGIAQVNDSLLKVASMSKLGQQTYYQEFIDKLKRADEKAAKEKALADKLAKQNQNSGISDFKAPSNLIQNQSELASKSNQSLPSNFGGGASISDFYFYNPTTVALGKIEFKKLWGDRELVENWRLVSKKASENDSAVEDAISSDLKNKTVEEKYTTDFYIKKLPTDGKVIANLNKDRNFAYFQLGTIYKEKFKEYQLAADKLEKLLVQNPEERLILPAMYNLYKIYEIINPDKALAMKALIISKYPESRYAQIVGEKTSDTKLSSKPDEAYQILYADYSKGLIRETLPSVEAAIEQFTGDEIEPKLELLKSNLIGKLKGLEEFKKALNFVALNFPNSQEGKSTEKFLAERVPYLDALSFSKDKPSTYKIIFPISFPEEASVKLLTEKIIKFTKERTSERLTFSDDVFLTDKNFIVIHGIQNQESAKQIASVLKDFKEYKISETEIIISTENYKIVQIKKNLDEFLSGKWTVNVLKVPEIKTSTLPEKANENKRIDNQENATNPPGDNNIPPAIQKLMDQEKLKNSNPQTIPLNPMFGDDKKN